MLHFYYVVELHNNVFLVYFLKKYLMGQGKHTIINMACKSNPTFKTF